MSARDPSDTALASVMRIVIPGGTGQVGTLLQAILDSRVESASVVGQGIAACARPPALWLQASTATIYAHRFDAPNDDVTA